MTRFLVSVLAMAALLASQACGKSGKNGSAGESSGDKAASSKPVQASGAGDESARKVPQTADSRKPARSAPGNEAPAGDSVTGLPICDRYLERVCACASKDPVLRKACDEGRKSAAKWKSSSAQDPEQRKVVSDSCAKALKMIEDSFGCKG